jgi:ribosomal protein L18
MYFRKKTSGGRAYLQIVESRREGAVVRQQVIATLGRLDELQRSGQLERLLRSGARFADKAILVEAVASGDVTASAADRAGQAPFSLERSLPHGCVAAVLGTACALGLERLLGPKNSAEANRPRDLVMAMIVSRVIAPE